MWLRHWGLAHDPFAGMLATYVSLPSHDEAVARLMFLVERRHRIIDLVGDAGLGKTVVARRASGLMRSSGRRPVLVPAPSAGRDVLWRLAEGMGLPMPPGSNDRAVWRALVRRLGSAALEGQHIVFIVDGWDDDLGPAAARDLAGLVEAAGRGGLSPTLIRVGRGAMDAAGDEAGSWTLPVRLERLTRSESETYLGARLQDAGSREPLFTPRAVGRLHWWSEGVPRALDELATVALVAGAVQGLEVVTPDIVDGVARLRPSGTGIEVAVR